MLAAALIAGVISARAESSGATAAMAPAATNTASVDAMTTLFGDPVIAKGTGFQIKRSELDQIVTGAREMLTQIYLKRGCLVPMHSHESEQMTYVLQGALKFLVGGMEVTLREGEVLHIPSRVEHQAEALEDTFELDVFSPIRQDWLDHTDDYLRR